MSGLTFPLICKPCVACGPGGHRLALIRREGLHSFLQSCSSSTVGECAVNNGGTSCSAGDSSHLASPWIAQEFINHGAVIIKAYAIGDFYHVAVRPSLPDILSTSLSSGSGLEPAMETFDSQQPYTATAAAIQDSGYHAEATSQRMPTQDAQELQGESRLRKDDANHQGAPW